MKICSFILIAVLVCSCSGRHAKTGDAISITDSYNRHITLTKKPERVISGSPVITEIMFALGLEKKLVGRTDFCLYPPAASKIASIGSLIDPGIETMASLKPDLVIASEHFRKDIVDQLNQLSIPTMVIRNQSSFDGTYAMIKQLASIFGVQNRGDSIVNSMKQRVSNVTKAAAGMSVHPKVYIVIDYGRTGDFTAGGNTFINQMITMAGGTNIAADTKGWAYSLEKLVEKDPDLIIIRPGEKQRFCQTRNYKNLRAVQSGHVYEIDNDLFDLTGPRLAEGLEKLHQVFQQFP